jgi:NDP-sugar pyrophosphorylase family protein
MLAAILAGGYGKRLRPLTDKIPKNLIEINGKPILVHQIEWLRRQGIRRVLLLVGYLSDKIVEYIGDGSKYDVRVEYSVESKPLGTGGSIKNAYKILSRERHFLLVNGDIITNINIYSLVETLNDDKDIIGVLSAVPLQSPYGLIEYDRDGYITEFREKPILENYWINAGVYVFRKDILDYLPEEGDIERTTLPELAKNRRLKVVRYMGVLWRSIDSIKDLEYVSKVLKSYDKVIRE